jgi:hypothetical protein
MMVGVGILAEPGGGGRFGIPTDAVAPSAADDGRGWSDHTGKEQTMTDHSADRGRRGTRLQARWLLLGLTLVAAAAVNLQAQATVSPPAQAGFTGLVTVRVIVADTGNRLGGSCVRLERVDPPGRAFEVCDNTSADLDKWPGVIRTRPIPLGVYVLSLVQAPPCYFHPPDVELRVRAGGNSWAFALDPVPSCGSA